MSELKYHKFEIEYYLYWEGSEIKAGEAAKMFVWAQTEHDAHQYIYYTYRDYTSKPIIQNTYRHVLGERE